MLLPTPAIAADIYVAAGESLQAAIDRALPGDRVLLAPGAVFTGNFRLPNKGASTEWITIRSAAPDTLLPPDGIRISPADAVNLPKIQSASTTSAIVAASGAHHWRLQYLEVRANVRGYGDIIALGAGDTSQTSIAQAPYNLVLDHLYIHGDPVIGQKRGISLHSGATWVRDCYISDIRAVGIDSQAISGYNGPGPWTVENNYLEASGENILIGGASPKIPNLVPADLTFRHNHLFKPLSWRNPILATPGAPTAAVSTGGSFPVGTYSYRIVAARKTALDAWTFSQRSVEVDVPVTVAGGRITVSWPAVPNATQYRVYRGSVAGAQDRFFDAMSTTFVDDGTGAGVAGNGDNMTGTVWLVKNLFELKLGERVLVEGNVMENCWLQAQTGYAVLFTPRNQDNTSPWIYIRDVEFINNVVRHASSGFQIQGYDNLATSQQTQRIRIANNVFDDLSSSKYGGSGRWVQIGVQAADIVLDHNVVVHDGPVVWAYETPNPGFVLTNNLFKHNTYGIRGDGRASGNDTLNTYFTSPVVRRNTFAGGNASNYPSDNFFPSVADWQAQFVSLSGSDFHLVSSSPYRNAGTDGLDLGPDMAIIEVNERIALSGQTSQATPPPPVAITTSSLPDGLSNSSYSTTVAATGGSGTYAWRVSGGALPAGLLLGAATGAITGTPTTPGTASFTVTAQDAKDGSNSANQGLTLRIVSTPPTVSVTSPVAGASITGTSVGLAASASDADGSVVRVDYYSGPGLVASAYAAPWTTTWTNVAPGTYQLTATATDNSGLTGTSSAVTVTVLAPPPVPPPPPPPEPSGRPAGEIVVWSANMTRMVGQWQRAADATAAGGFKIQTADAAGAPPAAPAVSPASYVETVFSAPAGVTYHVWVRMRSTSDSPSNDSVWVQFSDSVTPAGAPIYRVGTSDGLQVALQNCATCSLSGWGWQDKAWYSTRSDIRFVSSGLHVLRIQLREDGAQVDQVVLTPVASGAGAPGPLVNDSTILPASSVATDADVVLRAADVIATSIRGTWARTVDSTAAGGFALVNADQGAKTLDAPLASPPNYVDVSFPAVANTAYKVWVRLRATKDQKTNDSAWLQYSDAMVNGTAAYGLGTTSGVAVNLEACNGCNIRGWGWQSGAWWLPPSATLTFRYAGLHTVRIQAREDGVQFDQIVLSPAKYLTTPPGNDKDDTTVVQGDALPPAKTKRGGRK
jgi:hypothetical protein